MDRLRRLRWEIPTTLPFYSNNRRMGVPGGLEQHQADGSSSLDGSSRRMGDPNCSRTPRCCRGWRIRRKEASDDESFHPTVLLLLHRIHSSTCAPVSLIFSGPLSPLFSTSIIVSPIFYCYCGNRSANFPSAHCLVQLYSVNSVGTHDA